MLMLIVVVFWRLMVGLLYVVDVSLKFRMFSRRMLSSVKLCSMLSDVMWLVFWIGCVCFFDFVMFCVF